MDAAFLAAMPDGQHADAETTEILGKERNMAFTLPDLPYSHDALSSGGMSRETLEFHHDKHHKAYVDNGNKLAAEAGKLIAGKAVELGQNTLGFVVSFGIMLYLLFFLLRDGTRLAQRVRNAIPMEREHKQALADKFATVIRATVKGNLVVACAQGALGGLIFWILDIQGAVLWGVLMAFLSLLPAVGASLIWGPVSIYFMATGSVTQGLVLATYGVVVIGLVDNILRPILVGKDTKLPDYIVLITTLGGMSIFGLTGFVIGPAIAALFIACWEIFSPQQPDE